VGTYIYVVVVEDIGLFQLAAPEGMVVLVVVWLPPTHIHFIVSPTLTFNVAGVNEKSFTCTVYVVAKELFARTINSTKKNKPFFITILDFGE
jgi:hypothetical protein